MQKGLIVHTLITNDKEEVLILQRSRQDGVLPEYWDLPGGTLEDGEDPALGAIRETKEETGLDISSPRLFFHKSNIDVEKNKQFVTLIFWTQSPNSQIVLNQVDHQEYAWVQPSEVSRYKTVGYLSDCLAAYRNFKKNP